jgi:hypothetical protein
VIGIKYRRCTASTQKEGLKWDGKEGVWLPRGGGFVSVGVVRGREMRSVEDKEKMKERGSEVGRIGIGTGTCVLFRLVSQLEECLLSDTTRRR